ncbi:hypothetical protein AXE80_11015 [Wenyingzhuangia fucanilytica]|uniref:HTH araC/xylS-type domain-containing protein n=1 Tax=Wenyingzhuangia fucanilytica TaxID=1790137 RepID=A0A1B1Y7M1_9FLAO|nr:AraC family transcriptional regulator [Wenyingzhuangia fucanilytica]ANW96773.1 hypothetical protein AXE80_11015 [Wenyingzhuangia fucanilytica]
MKRLFSKYALNVFEFTLETWPHDSHTHNFYELILIKEGSGKHILNNVSFDYSVGHVFLLTPEDWHEFVIEAPTTFIYIKFTEQIFLEKQNFDKQTIWKEMVETILYKPNTIPECIIKDKEDKKALFQLTGMLLKEYVSNHFYTRALVLELFGAIMLIVARNLEKKNTSNSKVNQLEKEKISKVLSYIRKNIQNKDLLTQQHLAEMFLLSPNYVSTYLKKHTGQGLKSMILETRLMIAERMIKQSTFTIVQIADKVGFNDASHMNKTFKKYRGKNPTAYRKEFNSK